MPYAVDVASKWESIALTSAWLHQQRTFCECAAFIKREKVLLWRKKKAKARKQPSGSDSYYEYIVV